VLAEPQFLDVNGPDSRLRIPDRVPNDRLYIPRQRPAFIPIWPIPVLGPPA
jgi:hypothetical protein